MNRLTRLVACLAAALALAACHTHLGQGPVAAENTERFTLDRVIENIGFSEPGWAEPLFADLFLPQRRGPLPVVVTIHGGGWANRSRDDMTAICRKLASHGYAVFNISYRFAPRYTYPAQLQDVRQALAWIADNAGAYDLDTRRVNTWGYSSGAHLAALVGGFDSADANAVRLPRVNAVVAGGTPSDLRKYEQSPIVMRFLGGDRDAMPARYAEASPAYHVSAGDPPVFLYHGKLDRLVTPDQATDYYDALRAAGIDAELYLHAWRGHMSMFLFGGDAEDRAIEFLGRKNQPRLPDPGT